MSDPFKTCFTPLKADTPVIDRHCSLDLFRDNIFMGHSKEI